MICDLRLEEDLTGSALAERIALEFPASDVFAIARKSGLSIIYEKWFPVTLGEFDKRKRRITVNLNAEIPFEKIVAHELGHYFLEEYSPQRRGDAKNFDEEKFCDDFAEELLRNG